ncbi:MAG: alpha/beta hydrolase [Gloeomargarita sp. SKYBB_i_bin120]|nr:alpha/beta hydrolase [Gloeomargarita sp. SKYB120]MDW8177927.1 alpha/beta hydrolase [Gloeomargarita sp. SKYBB_i_bin120]
MYKQNGVKADALKTATLRAAQQPGGVTFLRILREFPGTTIRLNLVRGLAVITEVNRYITQVNHALAVLNQEFLQQARRQSLPPNLPDLTQRGPVTWQVKDLTLTDTRRQRNPTRPPLSFPTAWGTVARVLPISLNIWHLMGWPSFYPNTLAVMLAACNRC